MDQSNRTATTGKVLRSVSNVQAAGTRSNRVSSVDLAQTVDLGLGEHRNLIVGANGGIGSDDYQHFAV